MMRFTDWFAYNRDRAYMALGPLVITTRSRHAARERNAFEIGVEVGLSGLMKGTTAAP